MRCRARNGTGPGATEGAKRAFVRAVEAELERRGMSRGDLARSLGCTGNNLGQLLDLRKPGINLATAERLAGALGCRLLIGLVPDPPAPGAGAREEAEAADG